eukprot:CAMPEP_0170278026 /NCGR_PEP_ID=MMETSP0116_2-20130129/39012_1 /TAXON_ID=400756 /ORGANISM="Durinskia baltica, Strain CSIRO CS-38" /LENGTH=64 /DNA_ID=CAMNT_0010529327 /DNA_START=37 /DNA_END=228 /DNA_ORIENTATION=-
MTESQVMIPIIPLIRSALPPENAPLLDLIRSFAVVTVLTCAVIENKPAVDDFWAKFRFAILHMP